MTKSTSSKTRFIVEYAVKKSMNAPLHEGFHQYLLSDRPSNFEQNLMKMNILKTVEQTQSERYFGNIKTFIIYSEKEYLSKLAAEDKAND